MAASEREREREKHFIIHFSASNSLLRSQLDIQTLGSMVQAFDNFLINVSPPPLPPINTPSHSMTVCVLLQTLVVTSGNQSIKFNCPLSLSQLYELLRDSEPHRQLMHSAFAQFMHYLDIFNLLQQSLWPTNFTLWTPTPATSKFICDSPHFHSPFVHSNIHHIYSAAKSDNNHYDCHYSIISAVLRTTGARGDFEVNANNF